MVKVARYSVENWFALVTATGKLVKELMVPVSRVSAKLWVVTGKRLEDTNFSTRPSVTMLSMPVSIVRFPKIGIATEWTPGGRLVSLPRR